MNTDILETMDLVNGGKQNEYYISLTMAKKIGMMESSTTNK